MRVPYGIDVAQVMPPSISLSLEKSLRRTVPIVPTTDGDPAPGFVVGRMSAEPSTVQIIGPESHVRDVASATTEPVEIDGKTRARARRRDRWRHRFVGPAGGAVAQRDRRHRDPAGADRARRRRRARPIAESRHRASSQRIVPAVVRVGVRGQRDVLGRIRPDTIDAFVDLAGLGPGSYSLRVQVDPSEEVGVGAREPERRGSHHQMSVKKLFGTDGVRGKAGDYPLDRPTVARLGAALVRAMRPAATQKAGAERPLRFVVGRDTRESGTWIEQELARGAGSEGASVTSAGVIPTPAIAYVTPAMGFDAGIVISASHNPFEDNGIKVFSGKGEKFTESLEREVEAIMARTRLVGSGVGRGALRPHERHRRVHGAYPACAS